MIFFFPWAVLYRKLGFFGFWEMLFFIFMLALGFIYAWRKGALEFKWKISKPHNCRNAWTQRNRVSHRVLKTWSAGPGSFLFFNILSSRPAAAWNTCQPHAPITTSIASAPGCRVFHPVNPTCFLWSARFLTKSRRSWNKFMIKWQTLNGWWLSVFAHAPEDFIIITRRSKGLIRLFRWMFIFLAALQDRKMCSMV